MKPDQQPQLPAMPRDFSQPVECRGAELPAVIAEAHAAGYHAHGMTVKDVAVYRLQFWRTGAAETPAKTKVATILLEEHKQGY